MILQRFLLINDNPAVSKLVETSFNKLGIELTQISNYNDLVLGRYIGIIIDSQMYNKSYLEDLSALSILPSLIYIKSTYEFLPDGVEYFIEKPFLPTDFIIFINNIIKNNSDMEDLHVKPKENIFEILKDINEKPQTNKILKNDDVTEIQDIMFDDIFDMKRDSDFEDISDFKDYEELEKNERKSSFFDSDIEDLDELSEEAIQNVLDNALMSVYKPQKTSFEVVKDELKHTIEHSVAALAMQSQILRETLKGLKMNITITFEDK